MGRTKLTPILQPDDVTCGPSSLKTALAVFGIRKPMRELVALCKTNRNGTSTRNLITAANKLGFPVQAVTSATLRHLQSALRHQPNRERAVVVSFLSEVDGKDRPDAESGHWVTISSYLSAKARIVYLDSATGQKRSMPWSEFRTRWMDYDLKRTKNGRSYRFIRRWQPQLMLTIARDMAHLPRFSEKTARIYPARRTALTVRAS